MQLPLAAFHRDTLGRHGLFGLGQLTLDALQPLGQLTRVVLACPQTATEPGDLTPAVAREACVTVLCLDAQLLLGVLALLDTTQLVLTLCTAACSASSRSERSTRSSAASRTRCCRLAR